MILNKVNVVLNPKRITYNWFCIKRKSFPSAVDHKGKTKGNTAVITKARSKYKV
jgi:hypothetical protein